MNSLLSATLRWVLSSELRGKTKRALRRLSSTTLGKPLELDEFQYVLERKLCVRKNSSVLVHCSFGRLKANFSPAQAVMTLKDLVGEGGNILMPCYPGNGEEWLASGKVFDVQTTPIVTGVLAETFARTCGVRTSTHPIKAVAAWGKDRDFLIEGHHLSKTPYDSRSPYAKLLSLKNSLVIGLGTAKMSFYHCCEDSAPDYSRYLYTSNPVTGLCRTEDGSVEEVTTYVHRTEVLSGMPSSIEFLSRTRCPSYTVLEYRRRMFYAGDVRSIYRHVRDELARSEESRELGVNDEK